MLNNIPKFTSVFKDELEGLIIFKRSLGYKYSYKYAKKFIPLDKFFNSMNLNKKEITQEVYNAWCQKRDNESINNYAYRYFKLKVFVDYLKFNDYPNIYFKELSIKLQVEKKAYIFSLNEFENLLKEFDSYKYNDIGHKYSIPVIIRLLYSCGLRISEALNLKYENIDFENGFITILSSKNYVTRKIPISNSMLETLKNYRNKSIFINNGYLFHSISQKPINYNKIYKIFNEVLEKFNNKYNRSINATIHCFRHTFITNSLRKMLENGHDIHSVFLLLSKYVGHKGVKEVEYYVRFLDLESDIISTNYTSELFGGIFHE